MIDNIDNAIISLLAKRMRIVKKIGKYKKQKGLSPLDQKRWEEVLDSRIKKSKKLNLNPSLIKGFFNLIHECALEIEKIN